MKFICSPFEGGHQNFKVITGLNYRFTGNLHVHVFSLCETGIMTTSKDFTTCRIGTGRCCKKSFHEYTFLFLRIMFIQPVLNSNFSTKFYYFFNSFRSPSIIEKYGQIKVFCTTYASSFVIKYCIFLKTSISE